MCKGCHVDTLKCDIKDIRALCNAVLRMPPGFAIHNDLSKHVWYGTWVDDSPVPRNMFATQQEYDHVAMMDKKARQQFMTNLFSKPDYVIDWPGHGYTVGVHKVGDGYQLAFDNWRGGIPEEEVNKLTQLYGIESAKLVAQSQCQMYSETTLQDGSIQLRVSI